VESYSQKLKYDVILFGSKIGETTIEQKDSAGVKRYILNSNSEAKMLFVDKKSDMNTNVSFDKDGNLLNSFFQNIKDDGTVLTKAIWDSSKLLVDMNGTKMSYPGPVNFSSVLLYFAEPKNLQKVFSERVGKFFEMVRQSDGTYLATLDGHSAVYTYKSGKLVALEMKSTFGSVFLKLVQ
jgi:hypothetical protein